MRGVLLLGLLFAGAASAQQAGAAQQPENEDAAAEQVRLAQRDFEYGDYTRVAQRLSSLVEVGRFQTPELRARAYTLLGEALLLHTPPREAEAHRAFLELLYLDPDTELDPFYVPPRVIEFFEREKKELEPQLAPLRAQRRAEKEMRRKALEEEAVRRQREEAERRMRAIQPNVERTVVQHEFWVSLLPFGIGQLQNGDKSLGYTLATLEVIFGAASAGSTLLIETLRDEQTQKFGPGDYKIATRLEYVKWISAGAFYALWAFGAIHAAINYKAQTLVKDELLVGPAPGSTSSPVMPNPEPPPRTTPPDNRAPPPATPPPPRGEAEPPAAPSPEIPAPAAPPTVAMDQPDPSGP
ncbi:MAG TPA: hypothetical protein VG496_13460 [Myxococcales bacterium]|nr:hypothetical protein [Myxococcales bacterium]